MDYTGVLSHAEDSGRLRRIGNIWDKQRLLSIVSSLVFIANRHAHDPTDDFHMNIGRVLSSRVPDHHRVHALVLSLGPFDGEHTVAFAGLHVGPAVSLSDDLQ